MHRDSRSGHRPRCKYHVYALLQRVATPLLSDPLAQLGGQGQAGEVGAAVVEDLRRHVGLADLEQGQREGRRVLRFPAKFQVLARRHGH